MTGSKSQVIFYPRNRNCARIGRLAVLFRNTVNKALNLLWFRNRRPVSSIAERTVNFSLQNALEDLVGQTELCIQAHVYFFSWRLNYNELSSINQSVKM